MCKEWKGLVSVSKRVLDEIVMRRNWRGNPTSYIENELLYSGGLAASYRDVVLCCEACEPEPETLQQEHNELSQRMNTLQHPLERGHQERFWRKIGFAEQRCNGGR